MKTENISQSNGAIFATVLAIGALVSVMAFNASSANETFEKMNKADRQVHREEIAKAIETGNYAEFAKLTEGKKIAEKITEDNFSKFQELHTVKQQAKKLREELGFPSKRDRMHEKRHNMKHNMKQKMNNRNHENNKNHENKREESHRMGY